MSQRVVFDTSTLVSAALRDGSIPHQALTEAIRAGDVCGCITTLNELERVLNSNKFDRYLDRTSRSDFIALIRHHIHLFAVPDADNVIVNPSCRDPKDNQFLALALAAEADAIVSSDKDLLVLNPWRGIPIVTPAEFLSNAKVFTVARNKDPTKRK